MSGHPGLNREQAERQFQRAMGLIQRHTAEERQALEGQRVALQGQIARLAQEQAVLEERRSELEARLHHLEELEQALTALARANGMLRFTS